MYARLPKVHREESRTQGLDRLALPCRRAIRALLEAGISADSLAYYRGGVHDWVTLAMPTEALREMWRSKNLEDAGTGNDADSSGSQREPTE